MIVYTCICMNPRSRTRRTPCKLIERFPDQSQGQFRFNREDGYYLQASYFGVWWWYYRCLAQGLLLFGISQVGFQADAFDRRYVSFTTEEIRAFRQIPDYTAQVVQEFHCWVSLCEPEKLEGAPRRPVQQVHFHILVCERLVPLPRADLQGRDSEEVAYRFALAIAMASQRGFRLRDCGKSNWGFGMRNGRLLPLLLDGNSWVRLEPDDPLFGKWPPKKLIGSFWPLLAEIHPQAASEIEHQVYWPVDGTQFDAEGICAFLLRRLAGLDEPQQWNPLRWVWVPIYRLYSGASQLSFVDARRCVSAWLDDDSKLILWPWKIDHSYNVGPSYKMVYKHN